MVRRLRLWSGLVLFGYVLTHFLNHALGLVSLDALEAGRRVFLAVWRSPPATVLLYLSLLIHMGLGLWSLYQRRRLAMPAWEAAQLLTGLAIPPLLVLHLLGSRFATEVLGLEGSYAYILLIFFEFNPLGGLRQLVAMTIVWLHGIVGLHFWLRFRPWYPRLLPSGFAAALLVPVISLLGVLVAGRDVLRLARDPAWVEAVLDHANLPDQAGVDLVYTLESALLLGFAALLGLVLAGRLLRGWWLRRHGMVTLTYPGKRRVTVALGTTILEASRAGGIPHAAICGGRGRCSTCRIRIGRGQERLPPAAAAELRVLARVGAAPGVRLACQTRPRADTEVTPLLPPNVAPGAARSRPGYLQGQERRVAILFADLRGFTALSEHKLPFDVVFLLTRYFAAMGGAVEAAGGRVDKFIGDGVMALFGVEEGIEAGCRHALDAARGMAEQLAELNGALAGDLEAPLRIGIGIHAGPVIVGEMGYGRATSVTAIGDAVNTASRLEALTKELGAQLVLSEPVALAAGLDAAAFPARDIEIRGRSAPLAVRVVADARTLAPGGGAAPDPAAAAV